MMCIVISENHGNHQVAACGIFLLCTVRCMSAPAVCESSGREPWEAFYSDRAAIALGHDQQ